VLASVDAATRTTSASPACRSAATTRKPGRPRRATRHAVARLPAGVPRACWTRGSSSCSPPATRAARPGGLAGVRVRRRSPSAPVFDADIGFRSYTESELCGRLLQQLADRRPHRSPATPRLRRPPRRLGTGGIARRAPTLGAAPIPASPAPRRRRVRRGASRPCWPAPSGHRRRGPARGTASTGPDVTDARNGVTRKRVDADAALATRRRLRCARRRLQGSREQDVRCTGQSIVLSWAP